jgi:hypothetical protein
MGLFGDNKGEKEAECQEIVRKISKAISRAQPYFEWAATEAAKRSELNVLNHSRRLHERYKFLTKEYKAKLQEANLRKDERMRTEHPDKSSSIELPYFCLKNEAEWLAISAIDASYSLTEHVFIHAAILKGLILAGKRVANLADSDWGTKFKSCLDIKIYYDQLVSIKRQIRNYVAHGALGEMEKPLKFILAPAQCPCLCPTKQVVLAFPCKLEFNLTRKKQCRLYLSL